MFQKQRLDIVVYSPPCPPPNGTQVLSNYGYLRSDRLWEETEDSFLIALAIFYAAFALVAIIAFVFDCTKYAKAKDRSSLKGHKVTVNTPWTEKFKMIECSQIDCLIKLIYTRLTKNITKVVFCSVLQVILLNRDL